MQTRLLALAFAGGVDTKTDEYHVLPSKLAALSNGILTRTGAISKRWGYKKLGNSPLLQPGVLATQSPITNGAGLNYFNGELLAYDGQNAFAYSAARDAWAYKGSLVSVIQRNQQIARNNGQQLSPDMGTLSGVTVYAYEDSRNGGSLNYQVWDSATGKCLVPDAVLVSGSTNIRPKVLGFSASGRVLVLYMSSTTHDIRIATLNPSNPTAQPTIAPLIPSIGSAVFFDAQIIDNALVVAYYANSQTWLSAFDSTLTLLWTSNITGTAGGPGQLVITSDTQPNTGTVIWVAYCGSTPSVVSAVGFNDTGGIVVSRTTVISGVGTIQSLAGVIATPTDPAYQNAASYVSVFRVLAEVAGSAPQNELLETATLAQSGTATAQSVFARSVGLASKTFTYAGKWYVNVAFQTQQQPTYFTLDQTGNVVAKVNAGLGGGLIQNSDFMLPEVVQVTPGVFRYANLVKGIVNTEAGLVLALLGVNQTTLDFIDSDHFVSSAIMGGLYTVGGILQSYDGAQYVEAGYHVYPEPIALVGAGAGGNLGTGTYNYCVTYEWVDNNGLSLPSTPSVAVATTFVSGSTNQVTVTIPTLRLTKKQNVKIVVYRTTANGTTLYRVTSAVAPLYNNPAVDTVTLVDTLSDASIQANGAMYTQPLVATTTNGNPVLPNAAPPACSLIATYADRVFLGGLDDPYLLWYSQQSIAGAPAQFSAFLTLRMDPDGGGITALARMDDKFIIFKQNAIFLLIGQGPTATGDQNDFTDPIQIPSGGIGCVSQSSVVLTPLGLMFDSGNGIYLLDRGLNVSYKGAPVEAYTSPQGASYAGAIGSATLLPNQWALFTTADRGGLTLVYDYFYDQWSTFTGTGLVVDSVVQAGTPNLFAYMNSNGSVYLQTPGVFFDSSVPITLSLTTAWLPPGEKQGFGRVYEAFLLGHYKGTHTLDIAVATNYVPSFTALAAIPSDTALQLGAFGSSSPFGAEPLFGGGASSQPDASVYQFRVDVVQKCQAIRFQISDVQSAPGNEGFSIASLVMRVGVKRTGYKGIAPSKIAGAT